MGATLRVLRVVDGTSVDGPGLRTAVYLAGCGHHCPGCHNPSSWDFDGGVEMSVESVIGRIVDNDFDVTLTGGDPLYQLEAVIELAGAVKRLGKTVWCYTGFTYEQICAHNSMRRLLEWVDVLVDGPFLLERRDTDLLFRGSSNQRLIDVARSVPGSVRLYSQDYCVQ